MDLKKIAEKIYRTFVPTEEQRKKIAQLDVLSMNRNVDFKLIPEAYHERVEGYLNGDVKIESIPEYFHDRLKSLEKNVRTAESILESY